VIDGRASPQPQRRGCLLHSYCLEKGIEVHELKPFVCHMFPVWYGEGTFQQPEIVDRSLVCLKSTSLYRSAREDVRSTSATT
jgi:hypothetical protein